MKDEESCIMWKLNYDIK